MKIFYVNNDGIQDINYYELVSPPKFEGGPSLISMTPPSNGPKVRDLRVLLGKEFEGRIPERGTLAETKGGHPIIIKERDDDREGALVFVFGSQVIHRTGQRPNLTKETGWAQVVLWECGYGAWGYGYVALVKAKPGQWHFSTPTGQNWDRYGFFLEKNGELKTGRWSGEEFELLTGQEAKY